MVLDESVASVGLRGAGAAAPGIACPIAAEGSIKHYLLVFECRRDITASLEFGHRVAPARRHWCPSRDVRWYGTTREEIDADSICCPVNSVDATIVRVEATAIRLRVRSGDLATLVVALSGSVDVTIACSNASRHATVA